MTTTVPVPLPLARERGLAPTAAGLVLAAGALSWSAGSWLPGRVPRPASPAMRGSLR